jgi:hypothetical protein
MYTPGLHEAYTLARGRLRERRVTPDTPVVIDGFPASANTYSRQAFLVANPAIVNPTTHIHSPRVIIKAAQLGVPCILLIRDPRDAAASLVQRFEGVRLETALRYYSRYYRPLLGVKDDIVVAAFPDVVTDFGSIIRRCNEFYGADFAAPDPGAADEVVFRRIEQNARARNAGQVPESKVARPSSSRRSTADVLASLSPSQRHLVDEAVAIWNRFEVG